MPEKTILACLLHDIANAIFIKSDHGYWGAQLIEPYVDEEVTLGGPGAPGAAFLPRRVGRLLVSGNVRQAFRAGLRARRLHQGRVQARPRITSGT